MVKISVLYPNSKGSTFDINYYCNHHIPLVQKKLGAALKGISVDHGIGSPAAPAPYLAMAHLLMDTVESFQTEFSIHGAEIIADVPNYTNIQPTIQMSEIKM